MTVDFLKEEFGFSGRETVAIMGAHTFGRFHVEDSLYPYVWTSYGEALWNNDYYKYVVFVDMYFVLGRVWAIFSDHTYPYFLVHKVQVRVRVYTLSCVKPKEKNNILSYSL